MVLLSRRSWEDWIAQYEQSHQHPVNRRCHQLGIPLIVSSGLGVLPALFWPPLGWLLGALFVLGWSLQFLGHVFERKPPEFFKDWRFLFVGVRWWWWKLGR
jgi:uncharacterized membrane protein YGL010W